MHWKIRMNIQRKLWLVLEAISGYNRTCGRDCFCRFFFRIGIVWDKSGMEERISMIAVIDYDAGNLKSVEKALVSLGETVTVSRDREEILRADKVILPGVGAFGDAMERLSSYHLVDTIYQVVEKKTPFLGICLGLQLLFERSDESEGVKGLGILKGEILRIPDTGRKVPHMGWNSLAIREGATLFQGMEKKPYVYFVHSYYLKAADTKIVTATTEYGTQIHASVEKENIFACQFHPEKSGDVGLRILQNFAAL